MESTHETWDLATSVGATATMVAAGRARATTTGLIDDRFAEPLVRAVGIDFMTRWATGDLAAADVDIPGATWGMQQMTDLLAARTRYFDAFFGDAAAAGVRQAVILASGLDARGYRLDWPAGTVLFEIDMPDVLEFKGRALTDLRAEPTAEVRMVAVDLRDDWPAACAQRGSTRPGPPRGALRGYCRSCHPKRRTGCSTPSRRSVRPAAAWPPKWPSWAVIPRTGLSEQTAHGISNRFSRGGVNTDSTWIWVISGTRVRATTSTTTSKRGAGRRPGPHWPRCSTPPGSRCRARPTDGSR